MKREQWDERYGETDFIWAVEPNRFVVAETKDLPAGSALDLACGEGRNAIWLAEQGWQVTAVDFSRVGTEKGKRLAHLRGTEIEWVVADLVDYELGVGFYDLVLLCYLQVPEAERRLIMAKACRAVAPGGTLLWIAHDLSNLTHGVGGPKAPAVLSTPQDIVADLKGFEILKAHVVQRRVDEGAGVDGPEGGIALDTLVRAVRAAG